MEEDMTEPVRTWQLKNARANFSALVVSELVRPDPNALAVACNAAGLYSRLAQRPTHQSWAQPALSIRRAIH
jgi:hypothetical protein